MTLSFSASSSSLAFEKKRCFQQYFDRPVSVSSCRVATCCISLPLHGRFAVFPVFRLVSDSGAKVLLIYYDKISLLGTSFCIVNDRKLNRAGEAGGT